MPALEDVRNEQMHMHPIVRRLLLQRAAVLDKIVAYTVEDSLTDRERLLFRSAAAGGAL